jgi:U3 small nucleolar RNA-associated protein 19
MASTTTPSSAEAAAEIKRLLKPIVEERADAARLDELRRVFARLHASGQFTRNNHHHATDKSTTSSTQIKWQRFLATSHKTMVAQVCYKIKSGKRTAVRTMWGIVAGSPAISHGKNYHLLDTALLQQWTEAMSTWPEELQGDQSVRHAVETEFLHPYRDVQYYSMVAIATTANQIYEKYQTKREANASDRAERLLELLMMIPIATSQGELDRGGYLFEPPGDAVPEQTDDVSEEEDSSDDDDDEDEESDSEEEEEQDAPPRKKAKKDSRARFTFEKVQAHRKAWSKAWLAVLRLPLPVTALKQALRFLPEHVLPNVVNPLRFADFFMAAYNLSGVVPVLALDGLFLLMTEAGLEYPDFYKQLYKLITPSLLYVKYRIKFFRLLDKCLSRNEMLPAHVVAAFCKRLLRCALNGPVPSILYVLALTSNILRKHPEIECLVHRTVTELEDGFDAATDDPEQAGALQSSVWELGALQKHYHPAVVTLSKSLGRLEEAKAPMHVLEDFLAQTYKSLFEQERKRHERKSKTPVTFHKPDSLFTDSDMFTGIVSLPAAATK